MAPFFLFVNPESRIRRFWRRCSTTIIFWLLILFMIGVFVGATYLAFTVGVRVRFKP